MTKHRKYSSDAISPIVARCRSVRQVLLEFGLRATGGNYRAMAARIERYGLDTSHFKGQGWARGMSQETNPSIARIAQANSRTDTEIFSDAGTIVNGEALAKRMIRLGWKYQCAICSLSLWMGKPISLHVDHENGRKTDNRKENLRFLCPNCHQQTPTWGNGGAKRQMALF